MMQRAVNPNDTYVPAHWVARFKIVEALAQHGASVNVLAPFGGATASPLYILYDALGSHKVLYFLIQHGAQVDYRESQEWWTPLMGAVYERDTQGSQILIDAGANVNVRAGKTTPLALTVMTRKNGSIVIDKKTRDLLLKAGAKQ